MTAMATSPAGPSASKRPFYSDAGRGFVDALDLFIAEMFTGAPKKGLTRPKATSVKALVKTLFHAPYGFWVDDLASGAQPRKWRIRWKTATKPPSYRISGPQCNDIDELATVLGFESLATAGNPSEGKLVSLIALVPALVLLSSATDPLETFVAEHAFQVLDSFLRTASANPASTTSTTEFLLDVFRIANHMGSSVAAMNSLFPFSGDGKPGNSLCTEFEGSTLPSFRRMVLVLLEKCYASVNEAGSLSKVIQDQLLAAKKAPAIQFCIHCTKFKGASPAEIFHHDCALTEGTPAGKPVTKRVSNWKASLSICCIKCSSRAHSQCVDSTFRTGTTD